HRALVALDEPPLAFIDLDCAPRVIPKVNVEAIVGGADAQLDRRRSALRHGHGLDRVQGLGECVRGRRAALAPEKRSRQEKLERTRRNGPRRGRTSRLAGGEGLVGRVLEDLVVWPRDLDETLRGGQAFASARVLSIWRWGPRPCRELYQPFSCTAGI